LGCIGFSLTAIRGERHEIRVDCVGFGKGVDSLDGRGGMVGYDCFESVDVGSFLRMDIVEVIPYRVI